MAIAKPHPPPHTSLHPSPAAAAADGGNLTGTGPSSGERCGDTPGRYPHISTTRSLFPAPAPCAQPGPASSSISSSPPPPPPPRPFISSRSPGLSEPTSDFDRWQPGGADSGASKQGVGVGCGGMGSGGHLLFRAWGWEPRGLGPYQFLRGRGRHIGRRRGRSLTRGVRWAAGSGRAFVARKRQEGSGSQRPRALAGGRVGPEKRPHRKIGARRGGWEGRWRRDVAGRDLTNGARRIHQLKYSSICRRTVVRYRRPAFALELEPQAARLPRILV